MIKKITHWVSISLACLVMINCNLFKKNMDIETAKEIATISITKSSCFGTCEEYVLYVSKKNLVFNGIKNVNSIGVFSTNFDKKSYVELINVFNDNNFNSLDNNYLSSIRDLQTITIKYNDKVVKFHERNAPTELKKIMKELENIVFTFNSK